MKNVFFVGCKIVGLLQLYWACGTLIQLGFALSLMQSSAQTGPIGAVLSGTILYALFTFSVAYAMIFRTAALARIVGIPDSPDSVPMAPQAALLKTGILLLGVYFALVPIPAIFKHLANALCNGHIVERLSWIAQTVGYLCQMGLAVLLLKEPDLVFQFITRNRGSQDTAQEC